MRRPYPALLLIVAACTEAPGPDEVKIAASNVSAFDYTDLVFHDIETGSLASGGSTGWTLVEVAYRTTTVSFDIGSVHFELVPKDQIGESPLEPGWWVYEIDVDDPTSGSAGLSLAVGEPTE